MFNGKLNGALVTAAPALLPSTLNCTLVVFAETFVVIVMVPETVAPEVGEVMETVGGTALLTLMETATLVTVCPAAVLALAVSEWLPLLSVVVLSEKLNGALVTAAPALLPSTLNCTLVVFAETFVVIVMVPETVAPEVGEVMETNGAELLTWGRAVPPAQPAQSSPSTKNEHHHCTALGWAVDVPTRSVRKLIEALV